MSSANAPQIKSPSLLSRIKWPNVLLLLAAVGCVGLVLIKPKLGGEPPAIPGVANNSIGPFDSDAAPASASVAEVPAEGEPTARTPGEQTETPGFEVKIENGKVVKNVSNITGPMLAQMAREFERYAAAVGANAREKDAAAKAKSDEFPGVEKRAAASRSAKLKAKLKAERKRLQARAAARRRVPRRPSYQARPVSPSPARPSAAASPAPAAPAPSAPAAPAPAPRPSPSSGPSRGSSSGSSISAEFGQP